MGKLTKKMKWDCHLEGHQRDESLTVRNSARPEIEGWRCLKCRCLIYETNTRLVPMPGLEQLIEKPETVMAEVETGE